MRFILGILLLFWALFWGTSSPAEIILERKISAGGQLTSGNTQIQLLRTDFYFNRNRKWIDEVTIKGSLDTESSGGSQTMFKAFTSLRYGHSLSKNLYDFIKLEAEHDRFQNVNLRIIPTIGLGYWFADEKKFKSMIEGALGYQRNYFINLSQSESALLKLSSSCSFFNFSNQLDIYGALDDLENFRVVNEVNLRIKLNENYALKWSLRNEFNNRPPQGIQKNDLFTVLSFEYVFKSIY